MSSLAMRPKHDYVEVDKVFISVHYHSRVTVGAAYRGCSAG